jgi:hypothetical protein
MKPMPTTFEAASPLFDFALLALSWERGESEGGWALFDRGGKALAGIAWLIKCERVLLRQ